MNVELGYCVLQNAGDMGRYIYVVRSNYKILLAKQDNFQDVDDRCTYDCCGGVWHILCFGFVGGNIYGVEATPAQRVSLVTHPLAQSKSRDLVTMKPTNLI